MITVELFVLLKLFFENDVDWLWVILFIISDLIMWASLTSSIRGGE